MWGSGSVCSSSIFPLKGGPHPLRCSVVWGCDAWSLYRDLVTMRGASTPLKGGQMDENQGHPASIEQLSSPILQTQPPHHLLTFCYGRQYLFFLLSKLVYLVFLLPTASWLIRWPHAFKNGTGILVQANNKTPQVSVTPSPPSTVFVLLRKLSLDCMLATYGATCT